MQRYGHGTEGVSVTRGASEVLPAGGGPAVGLPEWSRPAANRTRVANGWAGSPPFLQSPFASSDGEVTLALIGGQRLLRDATAILLAREDGLRVLGSFESVVHYLAAGAEQPPAVLLLDCDENDPACWQSAIGKLSAPYLKCSIVLLCEEMRAEVIRCAIEQGVSGVVLKSYTTRQIREAIAYIATGRTVMPAGWQRAFARAAGKPLELSPRQRQILALIAQGRCNEEIAAELELSPNTVKFHVRVLYSRLGVHNRVEAANQHAQMTRGGG
jgi:two-component system nitrate/nitrite response regulator NarL